MSINNLESNFYNPWQPILDIIKYYTCVVVFFWVLDGTGNLLQSSGCCRRGLAGAGFIKNTLKKHNTTPNKLRNGFQNCKIPCNGHWMVPTGPPKPLPPYHCPPLGFYLPTHPPNPAYPRSWLILTLPSLS